MVHLDFLYHKTKMFKLELKLFLLTYQKTIISTIVFNCFELSSFVYKNNCSFKLP